MAETGRRWWSWHRDEALAIRPAHRRDRLALARLWSRCGMTSPVSDGAWETALCVGDDHGVLFVGERQRRVLASALAGHDGQRGWLYYVAVDPECQGTGVGRMMVDHAERWMGRQGVRRVTLLVREENRAAMGFYHRLGYSTLPHVPMSKPLKPR